MDPITHSLTGAALSRAGLHRATPLATLTLVMAANAPDIDALSMSQGSYAALAFRRGITHGPLGLLLLPLVVTAVVLGYDALRRRRGDAPRARPRAVLALSFIGCLTHPVLDWMNTYGIRLMEPFTSRWYYGDALFIIDPWAWLVLAAAVAGLTRSRRGAILWILFGAGASMLMVTTPQVPPGARLAWFIGVAVVVAVVVVQRRGGAPEEPRPVDEGLARASLGVVTVYIAGMVAASALARGITVKAVEEQGLELADVARQTLMVGPVPANPFRWEVVVRTDTMYHLGEFDWLRRPPVRWTGAIPTGRQDAAVLATLRLEEVRDFLRWSRFPYVERFEDEEGAAVRWGDARYPTQRGRGGLGGVLIRIDQAAGTYERPETGR